MNTLLQFAHAADEVLGTTAQTAPNVDEGTAILASAGFLLFAVILSIAFYVINSILLGRIFKKAGVESWIAWVPFYGNWKMLEIGGQQGYWAVLAIVPIVNYVSIVFTFIAMYNIGLKFGKSGGFVALGIFLPLVWIIWLAVDESKWNNALGAPSKAVEHTGANPAGTPPTPPVATV